jgi:hypothetical protein
MLLGPRKYSQKPLINHSEIYSMTDFFNEENVTVKTHVTNIIPHDEYKGKKVALPENEVLLSFRDDVQAEAFGDWWEANGRREFKTWCDEFGRVYDLVPNTEKETKEEVGR